MLILPKQTDKLLIEFLRSSKTVSEDQVKEAENLDKAISSGLVSACINMGYLDEEQIANKFCETYGLSRSKIKLSNLKTRPLLDKITDQFIIKNRIVPIDAVDDKVYVAVSDPSSLEEFNSMQVISNSSLVEASVVSL